MFGMFCAASSVADPDPDPVGSGLFGSPGSGSGKAPDTDLDPLFTKRPLGNALVLVPITEPFIRPNILVVLIVIKSEPYTKIVFLVFPPGFTVRMRG